MAANPNRYSCNLHSTGGRQFSRGLRQAFCAAGDSGATAFMAFVGAISSSTITSMRKYEYVNPALGTVHTPGSDHRMRITLIDATGATGKYYLRNLLAGTTPAEVAAVLVGAVKIGPVGGVAVAASILDSTG